MEYPDWSSFLDNVELDRLRYIIDCLRLSNDAAKMEIQAYKRKIEELTILTLPIPDDAVSIA